MKKRLGTVLIASIVLILLAVFGFSLYKILSSNKEYADSRALYDDAAARFTTVSDAAPSSESEKGALPPESGNEEETSPASEEEEGASAPIKVDFDALKEINPDVVGWIYCEDTVINYPVVKGKSNETYLKTGYDRKYSFTGSIFMDYRSSSDFSDANTVIYGHNMLDKSMFAGLQAWKDQSYFEAHPVMWLLTPSGDYRVRLFSGYTTDARSEAYTLIPANGDFLSQYLEKAARKSDFQAGFTADENGRFVMLSTCAYDYDHARYVLHGELERIGEAPAEEAGTTE